MQFCGLCGNMIEADPVQFEAEAFHKECLLVDDDVGPITKIVVDRFKDVEYLSSAIVFAPDIDGRKLLHAIEAYAERVLEDRVLCLYDCTLDRSAENGFLITSAGFYSRDPLSLTRFSVLFNQIESFTPHTQATDSGQEIIESIDLMVAGKSVNLKRGTIPSLKLEVFAAFIDDVLEYRKEGLLDATDSLVVIQDMDDEVKRAYMKLVMNMFVAKGATITYEDLEEMEVLMNQLNLSSPLRLECRDYLVGAKENTGRLIFELENNSPKGSQVGLRISLIKDLIRFHRLKEKDNPEAENPFIDKLAGIYGLSPEKRSVIEVSVEYDEQVLWGKTNDSMVANNGRVLALKAKGAGIPVAAVYISGSAAGLSAYGIVAAYELFNLTDVLRLPTLVTGLDELLIQRVAGSKKVKRVVGGGASEKVARRNFMIQQRITVNEKAVVGIAEDINNHVGNLVRSLRAKTMSVPDVEKWAEKIKRLTNTMNLLMKKSEELEDVLEQEP